MSETPIHRTTEEIEATIAKERALAQQAVAETAFFNAHARGANALADCQELERDGKSRLERVVLAQNEYHKVYVLDEEVDRKSVKKCVHQLNIWARNDPKCPLEIQINSPGGDIFEGFALIDFIRDLRDKGHTVTMTTYGVAASMAGVLLQAADVRRMGENSFLLIHEGALQAMGDYGHVEDEVALMKKLHSRVLAVLTERSKLTKKQIETKWKRRDWWLSAEEALAAGFVDEVA